MLEVNNEFINYFKDPSTWSYTKANRTDDRMRRIKGKVEDLVELGLISQIGTAKESKGTGIVDIYQFTIVGEVVAWIVGAMNTNRREYAINQLYKLFQDNFKDNPSCTDKFNSIYYRKCKEHSLFGTFIDRYRELLESNTAIMNRQGFFQHLLILPGYNIDSSVAFFTLWRESVSELDPETRTRFYHHIKLDFERKAEDECHAFGVFERLRYRMKNEPNSIVVEGRCKRCSLYRPVAFKLDGYMEMLHRDHPNGIIVTRCENCKRDDALEFPILI